MDRIDPKKPVHLICNPHSGYGGHRLMLGDLRQAIRQAGLELVEYTTKGPADATRYAKGITGMAAAAVVWGGDGTVHEVADGLAGSDVPIVACPVGTENLLAKELRMPGNPWAIADVITSGQIVDCDVGTVNSQHFLLIIGIGFDGEVVRRLSSRRGGHISHLSYFWPIWRTFWEHDFPRMRICVEGQEIFNDFGLAFVGNISRYAVGLRICKDARFDDGLLDLVVFRCNQQIGLLLHAGWTLLRLHPLKGDVIYRRVRNCRIETDRPVPTQVDGDMGPPTPLDIAVAPQRVKLLIPARRNNRMWP